MFKRISFLILAAQCFIAWQPALANNSQSKTFSANQTIGDGKNGRVFGKWIQGVDNRPIDFVEVTLRKTKGGGNAYVNLRFRGGQTFENGKRIALPNNQSRTVRWNLNSQSSGGKPLVLNAYNAEVFVQTAKVQYKVLAPPQNINKPQTQQPAFTGQTTSSSNSIQEDNPQAIEFCRQQRFIRKPRIQISRVRPSGGLFSSKHRVKGAIRGMCIEEAGYFENGQLKEEIDVPLSDRFGRHQFQVRVRGGRGGTIEVFTTDGRETVIEVDELIKNN